MEQEHTVRKMGLILRSIERMLKMQFSMGRNFTRQPDTLPLRSLLTVQCVKNALDECVDGISQTVGEVDVI